MKLVALAAVVLLAGCASSTAPVSSQGADLTEGADQNADLVKTIKKAYAAARDPQGQIFESEIDIPYAQLTGEARESFNMYASTASGGGIASGNLIARKATVLGQTILEVSGDLSDTGWEFGFYDVDGKPLAVAYHGQGENPGPDGIDWGN